MSLLRPWELHPMLVAFPIAFLIGGVVVDLWAMVHARPDRRRAATTLMTAGFWTGLVAAAAGGLAYFTVPAHTEAAHSLMLWHLGTAAMGLLLFGWSVWARRRSGTVVPGPAHTVVPCIAVILMIIAGKLGGHAVFRGGAGVDPAILAPEVRQGHSHAGEPDEGHPHEHEPDHSHPATSTRRAN